MNYPAFSTAYKAQDSKQLDVSENAPKHIMSGDFLAKLGRVLVAWLAPDTEPTITQVTDRKGQTWWRVDDPRTGKSYWLESETAVMIWLENN